MPLHNVKIENFTGEDRLLRAESVLQGLLESGRTLIGFSDDGKQTILVLDTVID